ncbi:MAG TPA: NAD(P)H-binding protein [Planctomycetota bacterium]|jgi:NADH dehydrogenase
MPESELHVVTGAFGYSGKYIAARLLTDGRRVRTLTNSTRRPDPFGGRVESAPLNFEQPERLAESLRGATVLYNTYWVRFNTKMFTHAQAVENTLRLFEAAKKVGVQRVIHVSITNPKEDSPLEYFRGKARLERALVDSGMSYSILRPAILFGREDILINNIAWMLRHLPVIGIFGDGQYRLQPIYVDDLAMLAVEQGQDRAKRIIDAIGPETFTYRELVQKIGEIIGRKRPVMSVSPRVGYWASWILGKLLGDVIVTRDEIQGLMQGYLCTNSPPAGQTKLTDWARENASTLGKHYASELRRRTQRDVPYFLEPRAEPRP